MIIFGGLVHDVRSKECYVINCQKANEKNQNYDNFEIKKIKELVRPGSFTS